MERIRITDEAFPLQIPEEVAVCPICKAAMVIREIVCWLPETGEAGTDDGDIDFGCVTEPPIESTTWSPWIAWHYRTPYVDWLSLSSMVAQWFNAHYEYRPNF